MIETFIMLFVLVTIASLTLYILIDLETKRRMK